MKKKHSLCPPLLYFLSGFLFCFSLFSGFFYTSFLFLSLPISSVTEGKIVIGRLIEGVTDMKAPGSTNSLPTNPDGKEKQHSLVTTFSPCNPISFKAPSQSGRWGRQVKGCGRDGSPTPSLTKKVGQKGKITTTTKINS